MKDRIQQFIDYKNISPGELAEILEVQRSNISHILNGRNKPGAAFIEKFLLAFPKINARWLFTGEGPMITDSDKRTEAPVPVKKEDKKQENFLPFENKKENDSVISKSSSPKILEKVVLLYSDGSFLSYNAE